MRSHSIIKIFIVFLLFSPWFAHAAEPLRIGSKRFTESYILAHILAKQAQTQGAETKVLPGLGNTAIVFAALRAGSIDLYPEYVGTINLEILKSSVPLSLEQMNLQLAPLGLAAGVSLGFNNGYALAMRAVDADQLEIKTLSDLARHPEQRLGLSNEFIGRADGWQGLAQRYGLKHVPSGIDHGLAYEAIAAKQIDVIDIYTTDAKIEHLGLRVLQDDRSYFPRYDALVLSRIEVPTRFPNAWRAVQTLQGSINEATMIALNARAELQGVAFEVIAKDHLSARSGEKLAASAAPKGFWEKLWGPDFLRLTLQHLGLVSAAVAVAALTGIPLAVLIFPFKRLRTLVLGAAGLLQTVPALAMLAALISFLGVIGVTPALLALILYALLPIMRNTCTGLAQVPEGLRQASRALGLTARQRMQSIELPLAFPSIIAGIRTATSIAIGTATIAAFIGAGGFGERIVTGLALNDGELLLAGALPTAFLAVLCEGIFELLEKLLQPPNESRFS